MLERDHYRLLAELFEYPDAGFPQRVHKVVAGVRARFPSAAAELDRFAELLPAADVTAMQELFIRSFDVQAITTLDIGYVLFGDDYKRGQLLANLSREHRTLDNDCGRELADHLPNVLRLLGKHPDEALLTEFAGEILAPALRSMIGEFGADHIARKNEAYKKHYKTIIDTPAVAGDAVMLYRFALMAVYAVLASDFALTEPKLAQATSDFLGALQRENEIEANATASS